MTDTIFALSSGGLPSGVAVLRISGPQSRVVIETMCNEQAFGTPVFLSSIRDPSTKALLDKGIVLTFLDPKSFTGEDVVELHVHGGIGVVEAILGALSSLKGFRAAEAGEFTYRAFTNGKLDLTQAEGIADLIACESEAQRKLAVDSMTGGAFEIVNEWSDRLLKMRALIEAEIDFVDEDDIPGSVSDQVWVQADQLIDQMEIYLEASKRSEVVRDGFHVVLLGKPNAGKSTLLNCLAKRDVVIVSSEPGTTRDTIEIKLNMNGRIVYINDTAGIRNTDSDIEREGIRRARDAASRANLTIWLHAGDDPDPMIESRENADIVILTKKELGNAANIKYDLATSVFENQGIAELLALIENRAINAADTDEPLLFGRKRQRDLLFEAKLFVERALINTNEPIELRAESLRSAALSLGKIVGMRNNEDILGVIFSEFCVGK